MCLLEIPFLYKKHFHGMLNPNENKQRCNLNIWWFKKWHQCYLHACFPPLSCIVIHPELPVVQPRRVRACYRSSDYSLFFRHVTLDYPLSTYCTLKPLWSICIGITWEISPHWMEVCPVKRTHTHTCSHNIFFFCTNSDSLFVYICTSSLTTLFTR